MKITPIYLFVLGAFAMVGQIQATTIFYDNFDSENGGVTFLNYGSTNQNGSGGSGGTTYNTHFTNWTVTAGAVDLVGWTHAGATGIQGPGAPSSTAGAPDYDYLPGNGLYVDLDGTVGNGAVPAGTVTSKAIPLVAGSYVLSFSLAGSHRGETKDTQISVIPGVTNKTITLAASAPFTNYMIGFTLASSQTVNLVFSDPDASDFTGALLDNVELDSVGCNLTLTGTATNNVTCNGGNNGSFTVSAAGGVNTNYFYSTNGTSYQSSGTFNNLTAGTYTVYVTNAVYVTNGAGCSASAPAIVTITQPGAVVVTFASSNNVTCNGGNNGSITMNTATGGSGTGYTYSDGGAYQGSPVFNNLTAGSYIITVRDGNSCVSAGLPVTITQPGVVVVTFASSNNVTCNGGNNGSITMNTATGGSGTGYTYSDGGAYQGSPVFNNLTAGSYIITARDGNSCVSAGLPVTITQPGAITITTDTTNQTMCAGSQVTWSVAASGPGALAYQWQRNGTNLLDGAGGFTGTTTAILTNSAASAQDAQNANDPPQGYVCVISSGTCSVYSTPASLTVNSIPTVSVNSVTNCGPVSTILTAITSANNPGYLWSDGETTASITNTPAATTNFTVVVTDGLTGCMNSGVGSITVNSIPTVSVNSVTNCGPASTILTATTSANNPGYLWSDGETTASITNTPTATTNYTVVVTDGLTGCVNSGNGVITVNPIPTVSVNSVTNCGTVSTVLTAITSANNPVYRWSDGETTASITNTPTATTNYTVVVTDGLTGCVNSGNGVITVNPIPTVSVNSVTNCGTVSTVLTAITSAGNPSYRWSDGETTASITNTPAASTNYTVVVTDGLTGCVNSGIGSITVNPIPTVSVNSVTNCGTVSTVLTAVTSANNPVYRWSDGETTASITNTPTATTNYTVVVTDGLTGCVNSGIGSITVNPIPTVSVNSVTNCGPVSTVLTVVTSAGNPSYRWSDGETTASITNTPAASTNYTVVVTDGLTGCVNSGIGSITVNPIPTVSVNSVTNCGPASTILTATTSAGNPSYRWSDGETTASITNTPAASTNYTVVVTDGLTGCVNSGIGSITVNPIPTVSVNSVTNCGPASTILTATTSAGNPSYRWSDGETTASITNTPAASTNYTVVVTDGLTGCVNSGIGSITVNPIPTVSVNSVTNCGPASTILTATTSAGNPSYRWSDGETTASITNTPAASTNYTVVVTDGLTGCVNSGNGSITVNPIPTVSVNSVTNCGPASTILTATTSAGNPSYRWSDGETTASITNTPAATTNYTVVVTDGLTGCVNSGNGSITVNPIPTAYSVTGGGSYCSGGTGVAVGLSGSQTNVTYQLFNGASPAGPAVTGTGNAISFGNQTVAGIYTVVATRSTASCTAGMSGSATVTINPLPAVTITSNPSFQFGSSGSGNGQFAYPWNVALDTNGDVYVVDLGNQRIQKFDSNGNYILQWGSVGHDIGKFAFDGSTTIGIAVDGNGYVYVTDNGNQRIQKFDSSGNFVRQWGTGGSGNGQFSYPCGVAIGGTNVYVVDSNNNRVQRFDTNGIYCSQWGGSGSANGLFSSPSAVAVDTSGNVYVADSGNYRIQKFNSTGSYQTQWGSEGAANGDFELPFGVAVDTSGNVYVADYINSNIQKFDSSGNYLTQWNSYNNANGQFDGPLGLAVDAGDDIYVADAYNNQIDVISPNSGSPTVCIRHPVSLTASGALTYGWSPATGLSATTGATVTANPAASTTYTVTGTNASGCTSTATVTVSPVPTFTLGASPSVARGTISASLPYSGITGSGNEFSISYDAAAHAAGFVDVAPTVLPASPVPLIVPAAAPVATYNATITVQNAAGCANSAAAFTITVTPAAFFAGPAQIGTPIDGVVNITFFGSPSNTFVVQTTTNLWVPWWTLKTNTMGTNGIWLFVDSHATNIQQFYRLAQP